MKICLVNNLLAPWSRGGAETVVEALAQAIVADGHEVFFIGTKPVKAGALKIQEQRHYYLPSHYHSLNKWPYLFKLIWHLVSFANYSRPRELKKILLKETPDLIITNNLIGVGLDLGRLARELNIKHLHILHDIQLLHPSGLMLYGRVGELATPLAKLYQRLTRVRLGSPRAVVAPSQWLMNEHIKRGFFADSLQAIIPNPIAKTINAVDNKPDNVFLFVGQVEEHKGVRLLLEAWQDFIDRTKAEAKLVIVGDGSQLEFIKKLATPQVEFRGRLVGQDLADAYNQASCLVVPSLCYENSPTVIYEATQANLPVIASALGGIKELLNPDYLFKPETGVLSDKLLWAYKKRRELLAPQITLTGPVDYWQTILSYIK
jgi:glycosyltransferase involved in cell wall biosynthesis